MNIALVPALHDCHGLCHMPKIHGHQELLALMMITATILIIPIILLWKFSYISSDQSRYEIPLKATSQGYAHSIKIGNQTESYGKDFTVMVTLRNSLLWVPRINCTGCGSGQQFDPSKSSTFLENGKEWALQSHSGAVSGVLGVDNVTLVSIVTSRSLVSYCTFGMATLMTGHEELQEMDGELGLLDVVDSAATVPFVHQIRRSLWEPKFIIDLSEQSSLVSGVVVYGIDGYESCGNSTSWMRYTSQTPYQFESILSMGSFNPSPVYMVMPELIPTITGPPEVIAGLASCAGAEYLNGDYVVNCNDTDTIPDLKIFGPPRPITSDKLITKMCFNGDKCVLALNIQSGIGFGPDIYLGGPVFKQYCVSVNFGRKQIGFSEMNGATPTRSIRTAKTCKPGPSQTTPPPNSSQGPFTREVVDTTTKLASEFYHCCLFIVILSVFLMK